MKRVFIFLFAFLYLLGQFTVSAKLAYCKDVLVSVNFDLTEGNESHACCPDFLKKKGQDCCSDEVISIQSLVDDHFSSTEESHFKITQAIVAVYHSVIIGVRKPSKSKVLVNMSSALPENLVLRYCSLLI